MKTLPEQSARAIAVLGTGSDVGKSMMVAALCRLFHRAGVCVAPFKAQNMSLNAFVTVDGGEIGRAQALQAQAAGIPAHVDMNPILLKPESDDVSQVIVQGRVLMKTNAHNYFERTPDLFRYVQDSYERLAQIHEVMVIEGAGSAAEVNLRDRDIVNWRVAEMAVSRSLPTPFRACARASTRAARSATCRFRRACRLASRHQARCFRRIHRFPH